MTALFVDAYYLIAVLNPRDAGHEAALKSAPARTTPLVTTEWVLVEAANSLSAPPLRDKFLELVDFLNIRPHVEIVPSTPARFEAGFRLYRQRSDKNWSLTDCLSFEVMRSFGLTDALTADHHFEQAGFVALLKDR
jgi:predicted nucleic acid-binding protein